jgi:hypothetical protein
MGCMDWSIIQTAESSIKNLPFVYKNYENNDIKFIVMYIICCKYMLIDYLKKKKIVIKENIFCQFLKKK